MGCAPSSNGNSGKVIPTAKPNERYLSDSHRPPGINTHYSDTSCATYTPPPETDSPPTNGSCIIAIDFGTSRSAFAIGIYGTDGSITCGVPPNSVLSHGVQLKAETCIILDEAMKAIGFGLGGRKNIYLENETSDKKKRMYLFQWFKMHLKDISSDNDLKVMATDFKGQQVSLMTVITEALRLMSKCAIEEISNRNAKIYQNNEIYWVVTVPAIWSPAASGFMRRAAFNAKMITSLLSPKLTLVREPEGACLDLLASIEKKELPGLQINRGTELVILDCGGGTNDMTFIRIESVNPLRSEELKSASGGSFGASIIEKYLHQLLESIFGTPKYQKMKVLPSFLELLDAWEMFKLGFDGEQKFKLVLSPVLDEFEGTYGDAQRISPTELNNLVSKYNASHSQVEGVEKTNQSIFLKSTLLKKWFDLVIDGIINDLKRDLQDPRCANIQYVYLVGGFCANRYLVQKINHFVDNNYRKRGVKVIQAKDPDLAIVKGAVLSLLRSGPTSFIKDRVSQFCYGIGATNLFDPAVHKPEQKFLASDGCYRVNVFIIYIFKGDSIANNFTTKPQLFQPLVATQGNLNFELHVIDQNIKPGTVIYMNDSRLRKMTSLRVRVDMSIPYEKRIVKVSIRFGTETQIVVKDLQDALITDVDGDFYRVQG